jgi:hypothetical protein
MGHWLEMCMNACSNQASEKAVLYACYGNPTYKYVHLDRTNLRAEMEQGAL